MPFDWAKFNKTVKKKFGKKPKKSAGKGGGKSNAWTAYVQSGKKR